MAFYLRYELEFRNVFDQVCNLGIYEDIDGDPVDSAYINGTVSPVVTRAVDNDRNPFTPIRGQELVAEIVSDTIGIEDFISDNDQRWRGVFTVAGQTAFIGYLIQEDSQEDFVEYAHVIRLKFTDGLGLLKETPLTDSGGNPWHATPDIMTIIRTCLLKTGLDLNVNVRCRLFPDDTADTTAAAAFALTKLYTRSFMTDQRSFKDCYTVLSEILTAWGCTLYQYRGEWVIDRVGDKIEGTTRHFTYDTLGAPSYVGTTFDTAAIGQAEVIREVEAPKLLSIARPAKEARVRYDFRRWSELIRNLDLDEGTVQVLLSGPTQITYSLDHWTLVSRTAYWRKELDALGTEKERYMLINGDSNNLDLDKYVRSETFPAVQGDKINVSVTACTQTNIAPTQFVFYVKCGSYYLDDDGTWGTGATFLRLDWFAAENTTTWKTYNIESEALPADGDVELRMLLLAGCGIGNETRIKDINIDYVPVIGNATSAKGDYNLLDNPVTVKNPVGATVTVSDALRKIYNGALLDASGALQVGWKRAGFVENLRFSALNALSYYQMRKRAKMQFEATLMGVTYPVQVADISVDMPIGFWPLFTSADTPGKLFIATTVDEVNWYTGIWKATLLEVYDPTADADITDFPDDDYEYNYVFE